AEGAPLFGARARLSSGETHWSSIPEWEREVTTDLEGRFSVQSEGYQGKQPIRLFATATPFHAEVELQFGKTDECDFAALRLPSVDVGTIKLSPAGVVEARLINKLGEPIEGAWITTSPGRGYTRSARDGRFRMEHRYLGGQRISIGRADYLGQDRTFAIPQGEALDLGDIVLETAPRVSGRVTDPEGRAVPGASVSTGGYTRGWVFDVEADGTFDVPLRKTSGGKIYSRADGYRQTDGQAVSPGESDLHIILNPHRPFYTIDVVDEATGEKLTDFGIKLRKGSLAEGEALPKDQWEWKAPKVEDHWYGRARMLAKAGYELVDLVAPGFERKVVALSIEPIHDQIQVVGLVSKGGIVGRLIGEEGPLANVSMSLHFGMVGRVKDHESDESVPLDEDQPLAQHLANQGMFSMLSMVPL
ncbi:MAG: carboxypeptidase-like regulatory domain-containing protein, partial [Planctomycetota bacterium]